MINDKDKKVINIISTDIASGRHLLRTEDEWDNFLEQFDVSFDDYTRLYEIITMMSQYSMIDETHLSLYEYEVFIYFKSCQDYVFSDALKNIIHII